MHAYALLYILDDISLENSSLQVYNFYRFQQSCWLLVVARAKQGLLELLGTVYSEGKLQSCLKLRNKANAKCQVPSGKCQMPNGYLFGS